MPHLAQTLGYVMKGTRSLSRSLSQSVEQAQESVGRRRTDSAPCRIRDYAAVLLCTAITADVSAEDIHLLFVVHPFPLLSLQGCHAFG
jgi:hypothetical protein